MVEIKIRFTYQRALMKWVIPVTSELRTAMKDGFEDKYVAMRGEFRMEFSPEDGNWMIFIPEEVV